MGRPRIATLAGIVLATTITALALPSAGMSATCSFANGELEVALEQRERLTVMREGSLIGVRTSAPEPCALVEAGQLEDVSITGTPGRDVVVVDLAGGPIEGGAEEEAGINEIELIVDLNSGAQDRLVVRAPAVGTTLVAGDGGVALNDDGDADVLSAGVEQVVLAGREGRDVLSGAGGRGTGGAASVSLRISGGPGDDAITGGRVADVLLGGAGRDDLSGASGDDILVGGQGADLEAGGRGDDLFRQGRQPDGNDLLFGQAGTDTVSYAARTGPVVVTIGVDADDGALGTLERDRVGSDVETVVGGAADDVLRAPPRSIAPYALFGGSGADILFGGAGDDLLNGGLGSDTVSYSHSRSRVRVDLRAGAARGMGNDRLVGLEDVVGSRFGDLLRGNALDNVIDGWRGADQLRGRSGADSLVGGPGNDVLRGDAGNDELDGEAGADRLHGGPGNDLLLGRAGGDSLFGGEGRDTLDGGSARDLCVDEGNRRRACERPL
ncbi:MAG: calcium-binding protein [Gaiellaceae bacterium]